MALINTSEDKRIANPNDSNSEIKVAAVWIVPTQYDKLVTMVQVIFFKQIEEGEISDGRIEGYVPIINGSPFNIGNAPTHMGLATFEEDLHAFAIEKLGQNFVKP